MENVSIPRGNTGEEVHLSTETIIERYLGFGPYHRATTAPEDSHIERKTAAVQKFAAGTAAFAPNILREYFHPNDRTHLETMAIKFANRVLYGNPNALHTMIDIFEMLDMEAEGEQISQKTVKSQGDYKSPVIRDYEPTPRQKLSFLSRQLDVMCGIDDEEAQ